MRKKIWWTWATQKGEMKEGMKRDDNNDEDVEGEDEEMEDNEEEDEDMEANVDGEGERKING